MRQYISWSWLSSTSWRKPKTSHYSSQSSITLPVTQCREVNETIDRLEVPPEGSKPLHFKTIYAQNSFVQFWMILKRNLVRCSHPLMEDVHADNKQEVEVNLK